VSLPVFEGNSQADNSIATSTLLDGFAQDINIINERLIEDASKELGLNGYRED